MGSLVAAYYLLDLRQYLPTGATSARFAGEKAQVMAAVLGEVTEAELVGPSDYPTLQYRAIALAYAEPYEQAAWVGYRLSRPELTRDVISRTDDFREDPMIRSGSATLDDYRRSGFDRGHLAPAADFKWSEAAMRESFLLSNVSPQRHAFNSGLWLELEQQTRAWALQHDSAVVVVGPILTPGLPTIGTSGVAIPEAFFKVVVDISPPTVEAIAFRVPQEPGPKPLRDFVVTLDALEAETGLDFLAPLPDSLEAPLEQANQTGYWFR